MRFSAPVAILLLIFASRSLAWSTAGHTIIAAIAYDVMAKEHPAELAKVMAILKQHPQYAESLKAKADAVPAENRDRYLFMIAARWPDDVRRAKGGYSHPTWHYVDFPIVAKGEAVKGEPPAKVNALTALADQAAVLKSSDASPADRAIAVCWVAHLVGDLHQPLHCSSLYTAALPKGDRGGNLTFIRVAENRRTINLHEFWDQTLGTSAKYADNANAATELRLRPGLGPDKLQQLKADNTPDLWAKESLALAEKVYLSGTLKGGTEEQGVLLPDGYTKQAKVAAERQAVLAGYRLADAMVAAVK